MKCIPIDEITEGMVVARNIVSSSGQILVSQGSLLTGEIIKALIKRGVDRIDVEGGEEEIQVSFTEQEIRDAEALCEEMVKKRFPQEISGRVMRKLYKSILHFEALDYLSHGR